MARRTIHIPDSTEALVRELADEDESFSAAVTRLVEAGVAAQGAGRPPVYVGLGEGPEDELGRRAEEYLRDPVTTDR